MKFHQILLGALAFLMACSSPKYGYHFDQYDYNVGRKNLTHTSQKVAKVSPLILEQPQLNAMASSSPDITSKVKMQSSSPKVLSTEANTVKERLEAMTKTQQKSLRKELRKDLKAYVKTISKDEGVHAVNATQQFDTLSGLAILFGVGGVVLITLASISNIFWVLGAISLVVGAFFFVKWVSNGNG